MTKTFYVFLIALVLSACANQPARLGETSRIPSSTEDTASFICSGFFRYKPVKDLLIQFTNGFTAFDISQGNKTLLSISNMEDHSEGKIHPTAITFGHRFYKLESSKKYGTLRAWVGKNSILMGHFDFGEQMMGPREKFDSDLRSSTFIPQLLCEKTQ